MTGVQTCALPISPAQARRADEMQAVADALSLLANVVMAWNTAEMQAVLDRWANRRQIVPPECSGALHRRGWSVSTCVASSGSPWSDTPGSSCRHKRQRKQAPTAEIDHANRPSAADSETNRNSRHDNHLRVSTRQNPRQCSRPTVTFGTENKGTPGREVVRGTRGGIDIEVIVEPNGRIVSGYPTNVPRNPR